MDTVIEGLGDIGTHWGNIELYWGYRIGDLSLRKFEQTEESPVRTVENPHCQSSGLEPSQWVLPPLWKSWRIFIM